MASSAPALSSIADTLASCALIIDRINAALTSNAGLILNRSQWQCLASSYSQVLQVLWRLLLQSASLAASSSMNAVLRVLHEAMVQGERCMGDCIASASPPFDIHSWLLDKVLKPGASTEVVHTHLHGFLWAFSSVLDVGLAISRLETDRVESELVQMTRALSNIWACENVKDDLSSTSDFLTAIKCHEEEGDTACLAEFILQKLMSGDQDVESVAPVHVLPAYLWVDSESLHRKPEILGQGGYGSVQEAFWLGGQFAVKDFFYVENNEVFGREAAIQVRLRHPNVMPLICCTKKPSLHKFSLVMELMQHDLRILMLKRIEAGRSPPFSLGVAVDLMLQIAQGMEHLHSLHIMHRDLKSSNVLVSFSSRACDYTVEEDNVCASIHLKISDFGMSKAKLASSKYTTKQVGATEFRAPEIMEEAEGEIANYTGAKYTKKADVYSFGMVCYEILTGNYPFEGTQVRKRVLAGERPTLPSYCPHALSRYIESCWSPEPSRRPPFSQICRVLRYFKASILLQKLHHQTPSHFGWLSQPLARNVGAEIDDMFGSLMQPRGTIFQPQPLKLPLEMYCCRMILQRQRGDYKSIINVRGGAVGRSYTKAMKKAGTEFKASLKRTLRRNRELQQAGGQGESSSRRTKGHGFGWLQKLLCAQGQLAELEMHNTLGLVRNFSIRELRLATVNFSKLIAEGGSAMVYHGKLQDGREIAVKVPKDNRRNQSMQFMQELRIASQLRHKNIVPLYGWCEDGEKLYLVNEFMANGDLARHIFGAESSPIVKNWEQRYKIACQLASALKYLHEDCGYSGIVHRDVKPWNVLLDSEWNVRLGFRYKK